MRVVGGAGGASCEDFAFCGELLRFRPTRLWQTRFSTHKTLTRRSIRLPPTQNASPTTCAACAAPLAHDAPRCVSATAIIVIKLASMTTGDGTSRCVEKHRAQRRQSRRKKYKEAVAEAVGVGAKTRRASVYICTQALHWKTKDRPRARMCVPRDVVVSRTCRNLRSKRRFWSQSNEAIWITMRGALQSRALQEAKSSATRNDARGGAFSGRVMIPRSG